MGEAQGTLFPLEFNRSLKLRSTPESLTADGGAVLLREVGALVDHLPRGC